MAESCSARSEIISPLPWTNFAPPFPNVLKRVTKSPKLHFLDAGLLAALRAITPAHLRRDRTPFGAMLETFTLGELLKIASWSDDRYIFSHFRDKERNEVDIVIEDNPRTGEAIAIAASTAPALKPGKALRDAVNAGRG